MSYLFVFILLMGFSWQEYWSVLFIIGDWNTKEKVKRYLELQASLALEYKMRQGKG